MRRRSFLVSGAAFGVSNSFAQTISSNALALSGGRFAIGDSEFMLADVMAPPLYVLGDEPPAHFDASRAALQSLLSDEIQTEDVLPPTRWGVRPVLAKLPGSDTTLQEALVTNGSVRVAPQTENHDFIHRLLALESEARTLRQGLWALDDYRVFSAEKADGAIDAFHLIEGTVLAAEKHGGRFYLNYGEDFRIDFTAGAASRLYSRWMKNGFDLATLQSARIRVRGFVEAINGPSIDLNHPLQIEVLN